MLRLSESPSDQHTPVVRSARERHTRSVEMHSHTDPQTPPPPPTCLACPSTLAPSGNSRPRELTHPEPIRRRRPARLSPPSCLDKSGGITTCSVDRRPAGALVSSRAELGGWVPRQVTRRVSSAGYLGRRGAGWCVEFARRSHRTHRRDLVMRAAFRRASEGQGCCCTAAKGRSSTPSDRSRSQLYSADNVGLGGYKWPRSFNMLAA